MRAGSEKGQLRPKRAAPGGTGPSRTVGAAYTGATCFRQCQGLPQHAFFETSQLGRIYLFSRGFQGQDGGRAGGHRNHRTLAIGNLTAGWPKRILGITYHPGMGRGGLVRRAPKHIKAAIRVSDRRPADSSSPAVHGPASARLVRKAFAADHPARDDRAADDLRAVDREFLDEPAERPPRGGQHRSPGAGCRAARHGAGFAGPADPDQRRCAGGGHQDGAAAPAARQRRPAGGDRPRHRYADVDGVVCHRRVVPDHAGDRQPDHPHRRARAGRGAIHRGGGR